MSVIYYTQGQNLTGLIHIMWVVIRFKIKQEKRYRVETMYVI
jgi:hypothetical protein